MLLYCLHRELMYIICEIWASYYLWGGWETSDSPFYRRQNSEVHDWPKVTLQLVKDQGLESRLNGPKWYAVCHWYDVCVCVCVCVCVRARTHIGRKYVCREREMDISPFTDSTPSFFPSHSLPNSSLHLVLPYSGVGTLTDVLRLVVSSEVD